MPLATKSAHRKDIRTGPAPMQHRHFATIAAIISTMPEASRAPAAYHFADHLQATNSNFDRDRFIAACMNRED